MRFSGQLGDPVDQPVKFARINIAVLQDVQADNLKFLKTFESGIHRVSIKSHDLFAQVTQHLIQDGGNHGFAHAALALLNEMNGRHTHLFLGLDSLIGVHVSRIRKLVAGSRNVAWPY